MMRVGDWWLWEVLHSVMYVDSHDSSFVKAARQRVV